MAGRRPLPSNVHVLRGNPGKRRRNPAEPRPAQRLPDCPAVLSETARAEWPGVVALIAEVKEDKAVNVLALSQLCEALADFRAAGTAVAEHGLTYVTETGQIKANPAVRLRADADRRIRAWLVEFGLTPAARSRLTGGKDDATHEADPWADFV